MLSLAAAVSLGVTRFAYALLLPPMRADLVWSYTLAGSMNTANALGYLMGALLTPVLLRRWAVTRMVWVSALMASVCMVAGGLVVWTPALLAQRWMAGVLSAVLLVAGGVLATRIASQAPGHSGRLLGVYYGGTGWGIVASAWLVPGAAWLSHVVQTKGMDTSQWLWPWSWQWAWWGLGLWCALAAMVLRRVTGALEQSDGLPKTTAPTAAAAMPLRALVVAARAILLGYGCFGLGYIGYMTFVVALLREQGASTTDVTVFYSLLGVAVLASPWVWARLLHNSRGGQALGTLNALLGCATVLPALSSAWPAMMASGMLFGLVFLSIVASTTAWVKHNLSAAHWASGISLFTVVFALGQMAGPTVVGAIADHAGGLRAGLLVSAVVLWAGAAVAFRQKPLAQS